MLFISHILMQSHIIYIFYKDFATFETYDIHISRMTSRIIPYMAGCNSSDQMVKINYGSNLIVHQTPCKTTDKDMIYFYVTGKDY